MPYERQVGQTGKTVRPSSISPLCFRSHSASRGHTGAEKIVAINFDPKAPIFRVADVGIVGNYLQVVPELIRQLKVRMGQAK
jgi:electron transfer flavoprotein alpha subunit